MSTVWVGVILLAAMNALFKSVGPVVLAGKELPNWFAMLVDAVGQCLLASLVVVAILGAGGTSLDWAIVAGALVAVVLRLTHRHELVCVLAATLTTILVRLF